MKWINLKDFKCPECSALLNQSLLDSFYRCTGCAFKIDKSKFDSIVADFYSKKSRSLKSDLEKLSEWNNFGRKKVTEDFSDSPHLNV